MTYPIPRRAPELNAWVKNFMSSGNIFVHWHALINSLPIIDEKARICLYISTILNILPENISWNKAITVLMKSSWKSSSMHFSGTSEEVFSNACVKPFTICLSTLKMNFLFKILESTYLFWINLRKIKEKCTWCMQRYQNHLIHLK